MSFHATIFTLFPEMFPGTLGYALSGKARDKKIWDYKLVDLRDFSPRADRRVDDRPYGGGAGMVIKADIIDDALEAYIKNPENLMGAKQKKLIYFSPRGAQLTQNMVQDYAQEKEVFLIAGRYEGIDERVIEKWQMQEICIGPYILSGGELAAQIFLDAIIRLLPETVGNPVSLNEESFGAGFEGEYPHYTRPQNWQGREVPEILASGDHQAIEKWRQARARPYPKK